MHLFKTNIQICFPCICNLGFPGIFIEDLLLFWYWIPLFEFLPICPQTLVAICRNIVFVMFSGQWPPGKFYPSFTFTIVDPFRFKHLLVYTIQGSNLTMDEFKQQTRQSHIMIWHVWQWAYVNIAVDACKLALHPYIMFHRYLMMMPCHVNIFHITGPLWGESTYHRWIPHHIGPAM